MMKQPFIQIYGIISLTKFYIQFNFYVTLFLKVAIVFYSVLINDSLKLMQPKFYKSSKWIG